MKNDKTCSEESLKSLSIGNDEDTFKDTLKTVCNEIYTNLGLPIGADYCAADARATKAVYDYYNLIRTDAWNRFIDRKAYLFVPIRQWDLFCLTMQDRNLKFTNRAYIFRFPYDVTKNYGLDGAYVYNGPLGVDVYPRPVYEELSCIIFSEVML
jgi:hypothetical protein